MPKKTPPQKPRAPEPVAPPTDVPEVRTVRKPTAARRIADVLPITDARLTPERLASELHRLSTLAARGDKAAARRLKEISDTASAAADARED